jgi:hypothetical protein
MGCREIGLYDAAAGEWHRADVLCGAGTPNATVLELQHSSISEQERMEREAFYRQKHRMFWLVHRMMSLASPAPASASPSALAHRDRGRP